ncbi:MAG: LysE family translocator [Bacteroidia bacterium]
MAFLQGVLLGLPLALLIGPVLFTLLQGSLRHGWRGGMAVAVGITVSDIVAVALLLWGAGDWLTSENVQWWLAVMAAVLLTGLGLRYLIKPPVTMEQPKVTKRGLLIWAVQGYLVNFVNPAVFAIWLGYLGYATGEYGEDGRAIFLIGVITSVFITDALKAIFADKLLGLLKPAWLRKFYLAIGILLIGAAIFVLWRLWVGA